MFAVRRNLERGYFDHGWLKTFHTFSFGDYFDRHQMHFRNLRVINEDRVAPGHGFETHPHKDMEIITYVISGALEHRDSMGNGAVIRPGEIQYMSAGSGVLHSEKNPSKDAECHLLQIWILPDEKDLPPRYDQRPFEVGPLVRLVAPDSDASRGEAIGIRAATSIYAGKVPLGHTQDIALKHGFGWIQVVSGSLVVRSLRADINGDSKVEEVADEMASSVTVTAGDGVAISDEPSIQLEVAGGAGVELLLFDLP